ncbi:hypothetical protein KY284_029840 [Solanum tuberosum]|nr:hypothetical protein KY284_029840 [Solanum tuberosum]
MPTLNLFTNLPVDAVIASDILKDATKAVAKIIGKPDYVPFFQNALTVSLPPKVGYVMILLNGGVPIAFAGTEAPAAYGELISIGGLGPSVNGKLSSTIAEILQTKLSIDSDRFYIKFYDSPLNYPYWDSSMEISYNPIGIVSPIFWVQWLNFLMNLLKKNCSGVWRRNFLVQQQFKTSSALNCDRFTEEVNPSDMFNW